MRILIATTMAFALGCGNTATPVPATDASVETLADTTPPPPDTAPVDTAPDVPRTCTRSLDCGDVSLFVCDPATSLCRPADCDPANRCPVGKHCVKQWTGITVGICLKSCSSPGAAGECDASEVCVGVPGALRSYCRKRGGASLGADCNVSDVDTGCAEGFCRGATLEDAKGKCVAACDPFSSKSICPAGKICTVSWDCGVDAALADPAALETFCAKPNAPCAVTEGAQGGHCLTTYNATVCRRGCRLGGSDCPATFGCGAPFPLRADDGLGLCIPRQDESACHDGGSGTCAECRVLEEATGGCCAGESAACTTPECKAFVDCAIACKRDVPCVSACAAIAPAEAKLGTPLFLCLSGYASPSGGACGDVCLGPSTCGDFDGPDIPSTCTGCSPLTDSSCRKNRCFNGFYCNRVTSKCSNPRNATMACAAGDAGVDGG